MKANSIWRKIIFIVLLIMLFSYFIWAKCYSYNIEKATKYLTENTLEKSHNCCAWYIMRATQAGGCPNLILPAWAYEYYLPFLEWEEINTNNYKPQLGDICVFPRVKHHIFGHIAMWNGEQWISDFKQKSIIVNKAYTNYKVFRYKKK